VITSLIGWVYSWYVFRGVRVEYASDLIGAMPRWLVVLFGVTTTVLIATMISAGMRLNFWPALAIAASFGFVIGLLGGHYGVMTSIIETIGDGVARPSLANVFEETLRNRSAVEVTLIAAVPTILLLSGLTGWLLPILQHRSDGRVPAAVE
jgi:hypothetical protein